MRELKLPCKLKLAPPNSNALRRGSGLHRGGELTNSLAGGIEQLLTGRLLVDKKQPLPRSDITIGF
jgi:hypothetical protein